MKRIKAFTLIELLTTVSVIGILFAIGVPAFTSYSQSNRLITDTNSFVGALNITRSEAVKRRRNISICPSNDGATCGNGLAWNVGYIIFVNLDNDDPAQVDADEEIVKIYGSLNASSNLLASAALTQSITYRPNGFSNAQGEFILCKGSEAPTARSISVGRTGRPSVSKGGGTCSP